MTYHTTALLPNSCGPMADGPFRDPKGRSYPHPKYWTHRWRIDINIDHGISPIESSQENQGTWHITRRHYYQIAAAQWRMVHFGTPRVGPIHTPNIGPIDEGLIPISTMESHHRFQLREPGHMTYHTTALLPNSCGPMADGPFRDPKGRSYPHPKYWTHRWRIDINIDHGISPIESSQENQGTWHITRRHYYQIAAALWRMVHFGTPRVSPIHTLNIGPIDEGWIDINIDHGISPIESSQENQGTWHITRRHYYQIAAAQWRMVHFGTPRVGPIHTPNIGPIDEGLISISIMESHHRFQLREPGHMTYHTTALLPKSCGPMADGPFRDPKGRSYPHPKYWTHRWRIDINIDHGISP